MVFACKSACVAYNTAKYHRAQDRQFDEQCLAAMDYAGELLESRAFQRALEGDVEPILYMGVVVGHIRKFDSKLQIEMLRAYKPDRYKTPGTTVNVGTKGDIFVLTEEQRHELQATVFGQAVSRTRLPDHTRRLRAFARTAGP
jgi:hypothetical protein